MYNIQCILKILKILKIGGYMIYRAKCLDCKHEWTSREGFGTPNYCPKCKKRRITVSPIGC